MVVIVINNQLIVLLCIHTVRLLRMKAGADSRRSTSASVSATWAKGGRAAAYCSARATSTWAQAATRAANASASLGSKRRRVS